MPEEQVHLVVRKPLADIEADIRRRHHLSAALSDVTLENDALVFTFDAGSHSAAAGESVSLPKLPSPSLSPGIRRRKKRRVRNRMKTRGWDAVAKFRNSRGQTCTIYKPFLNALSTKKLKTREAYSVVKSILVSNGNSPRPSSIEYFLSNTLEYIDAQGERAERGVRRPESTSEDTSSRGV